MSIMAIDKMDRVVLKICLEFLVFGRVALQHTRARTIWPNGPVPRQMSDQDSASEQISVMVCEGAVGWHTNVAQRAEEDNVKVEPSSVQVAKELLDGVDGVEELETICLR